MQAPGAQAAGGGGAPNPTRPARRAARGPALPHPRQGCLPFRHAQPLGLRAPGGLGRRRGPRLARTQPSHSDGGSGDAAPNGAAPNGAAPNGAAPNGAAPPRRVADGCNPAVEECAFEPSLPRMLLQLPLEMAELIGNEDSHYLERRKRSRWWSGGPPGGDGAAAPSSAWPRLPSESLAQLHCHPPPLALWQKVLPLGAVFFAASFNLTILQNLKDAIMVTTAGAETLPFLSSLVVLPASLGFFFAYGRMSEALPPRAVFYAAVAPLVAFYALFTAVLYPLHGALHPAGLTAALAGAVPVGLHGLLKVAEHWTFSLFFCAAELWGSVVISVLFWSLANEVCSLREAKAVYPLMGIAANVALVLSGSFVKHVNAALAGGSTQAMLNYLVGAVVVMTAAMAAVKAGLDRWVITPYAGAGGGGGEAGAAKPEKKEKKAKGSLRDCFDEVRASPKIKNLAALVVCYGVSHRLFEFAWKAQLRVLFPTATAYQSVLADVSIATGWATIAFMLLGKFVFTHLGWSAAALATPAAMAVSGAAFFGLSLAAAAGVSVGGMAPPAMALAGVAAGAATQVFARSAKFSLFDPAKEMVYIEMSREEKGRGKAAVDLLGSQVGKSGGAWVTQALLLVAGSISAALPVIAAVFAGVLAAWLAAVGALSRLLREYEDEKRAAALAEFVAGEETEAEDAPARPPPRAGAPAVAAAAA